MNDPRRHLRILILDDDPAIRDIFKAILEPPAAGQETRRLKSLEEKLFLKRGQEEVSHSYHLTLCRQAEEAVEQVTLAQEENDPFALAFIDVRLPPGPDGVWAAEKIRLIDPYIQIVVVTAFSDIHPSEIARRVPPRHRLLYLQKPFHRLEIEHLAAGLGAKWISEVQLDLIHDELERKVDQRTAELVNLNQRLEEDIAQRKEAQERLEEKERQLQGQTQRLEQVNTAMKVLLEHLEDEKEAQQREMVTTLQRLVLPYLENLGQTKLTERQEAYLESALTNLRDVASRFSAKLTAGEISLTPVELQVADMLKQGKSSKEIADLMSISTTTVAFHRRNIRRKLGLTNQGINLKTYLQSQS